MEDQEIRPTFMDIALRAFFFYCVAVFLTGVIIHILWLMKAVQMIPVETILNWLSAVPPG